MARLQNGKFGQRLQKLDFEKMIAKGENPNGFSAETPNGSARATGTGWNRARPWGMPEISPSEVWPEGRSNRTGE